PYISRKELLELREYIQSYDLSGEPIICDQNVESYLHSFKDYSMQFSFIIQFETFDSASNNNLYKVFYCPQSLVSIEGIERKRTFAQIRGLFATWVDSVKKMEEITKKYYEPFANFYNNEFTDFFINDDGDSNINPFEIDRQELIYYFLIFAKKRIFQSNDLSNKDKELLIIDVCYLEEELPNLTKKNFVDALSKFAQKTKQMSNKLFHDIFDVLKKEIIKKLLYKGADQIPNFVNKVENWLNLFT
ncbi:MAG TPA: hypothetical protein PJ990_21015, partial [Saprospiraceae bacterium]|nr:hypothetical protein [Saprospiraceae bacterium]